LIAGAGMVAIIFLLVRRGGTNFDIGDYAFVNLAAEYEINARFSVFARIDSITNEQYSEVFGFPALGRAAYGE